MGSNMAGSDVFEAMGFGWVRNGWFQSHGFEVDGFEHRLGSKEGFRTVSNQMGSKRRVSRLGTS